MFKQKRLVNKSEILLLNSFLIILGIVALDDIRILGIVLLFSIFFMLLIGIHHKKIFYKIFCLLPLITLISLPILFGGGFLPSEQRAILAFQLVSKIVSTSIVLIYVGESRSAEELLDGLFFLKIPKEMIAIIMLSFRYSVMIRKDIFKGYLALKSRGFNNIKIYRSLNVIGELIGGFFLRSIDHSEKVYQAMKSRGFSMYIPIEKNVKTSFKDLIFTMIIILVFFIINLFERSFI
jgi:cobalt/nickel transport system permease protein